MGGALARRLIFDAGAADEGPQGLCFKTWQLFADSMPVLWQAVAWGIIPVEALVDAGA